VNTLSNDGSNCVDSCTNGYQTGQQACDTLSNLCYSLDDGALNSNYETYTYSNGQCVAPTPCSNAEDFGVCQFPASTDPSLSWSNIGSSDTECDSTNIGTQKVRTFNQQATVSQSNDGNCQYDSSARNTYTRTVTSNLDENCTPYLAGTFTASYNSAQSKITVSGNLNGSIYDDDTFITMQIENGEFSYRSAALRTPFVFNPSDTDNYDGKKLSLRLENLINGVTHISNTISNIEIELDRETSCISQEDTCWSLSGTSLSSDSVSRTWNGSSCVTSCTPNYLSANAACASLTNTCYSVSNYETIVTSSSTMVPDSTQCIPQNTCTYTGAFTISIDSVVARVNASLDLMFDNTLTTPNAQFYIVKTANQREVKLYEATNGKYLYINNSKCILSGSSSTFKIFKTGTNKQYHVKNVLGEWWGNLFGTNKQGTFTSSEKTIITTSIEIPDQFLSEYNVDCMFELVSDIGNSDRCLSESCVRTKQIKLKEKPSGDGLTCSNFITRTYGTGFTYDGSFDELNSNDVIEITSDCQTRIRCCTSNDINYKFEAYYNTQFSAVPGSTNEIITKSAYDGYSDNDTFTVTLPQNTGYDDLDYTFTKAQWENNELPDLDITNMGRTWRPNQIKLTKTYGHPDNPSCIPSILDNLPGLGDPIFNNISHTIPIPPCDSTNPNHYTGEYLYLEQNGSFGFTTVSGIESYSNCQNTVDRYKQWNPDNCIPPDNAFQWAGDSNFYDSNYETCEPGLDTCDPNNPNHYTTSAQYLYSSNGDVSPTYSNAYDTCASSIMRHRQWDTTKCESPDGAISNSGQYYDMGLECFEVDADFIDGLLGSGSTKYAVGDEITIDTRTKVKIGGTSSVVLDTQFSHSYVWKVFKKTGSSFGTPIAQWTNNDSSYSIFEQESLTLNTFIDTVDNSDSKHNKTYKIEVSVTRISDGYIPDTKSIQFKYFQYEMDVRSVVNNVSYNNNTNQLTINLKTGPDYELGHWGEDDTRIRFYSSETIINHNKQKKLNKKTLVHGAYVIIFNQVFLSETTLYFELYHEKTNMSTVRTSYDIELCASNYVDGSYLYGDNPFTTSSSIDAYSNCLTSITRYSEFQSNCVIPSNVITENGKNYDPNSGVQCEQPYTLGSIDLIYQVSYNAITQTLNILTSDQTFVSGTTGPSGAKFMIQISDALETFISFPSTSFSAVERATEGLAAWAAAARAAAAQAVPPSRLAMGSSGLATQAMGSSVLESDITPIGTGIHRYSNDLQSLEFQNVELRSTQQVELFMVDSSNNIVSSVDSHNITDKLQQASFGVDIPTDKPSVIGISQDNKTITLKVTQAQRNNWVIYEDTKIKIQLRNDDKYLNLSKISETSNTGITLGTSDMKMSFSNSISSNDYELVLDVTDDYNLDEPATLHFTFYNGTTAIGSYTEVGLPTCGFITQESKSCFPSYNDVKYQPCARDPYTNTWYKAKAGSKYTVVNCLTPSCQGDDCSYDPQSGYTKGFYQQQVNFKKTDNANCYGPETRIGYSESRNRQLLIDHGCPSQ
jgi:hypothetical protein